MPETIASDPSSTFDRRRFPVSFKARIGISQRMGATNPTARNSERGPGPNLRTASTAGDDRQVGDHGPRGRADPHFPRFGDRRCSLDVSRPHQRLELSGTGPAGRGVPQHRTGKIECDVCNKVPEFVNQHRDGEGNRAANNRGQPPVGAEPLAASRPLLSRFEPPQGHGTALGSAIHSSSPRNTRGAPWL